MVECHTAQKRASQHIQTLEAAKISIPSPYIVDDIISLKKFMHLAGNLGTPVSLRDGATAYTIQALNVYGQVRNGYNYISHV